MSAPDDFARSAAIAGVSVPLPEGYSIAEATDVTDELVEAFRVLTPQLSSSSPAPDRVALEEIVA